MNLGEVLFAGETVRQRLQWLGVKAKIEIPLSGTGFNVNVRQNTLRIEHLPELANGCGKCLERTLL